MGSIVASLPKSGFPDTTTVDAMLAAAPHRAVRTRTVVHGETALGIGTGQQDDASLGGDGDTAVAFTGILDNLHQIAGEAKEAGSTPLSLEPSDVLAAAFRAFGLDLSRRLRGVFGAIISDGKHLWCIRDQLGFGTVYYRRDRNGSYAASEAKQVVAGAGLSPEPDLDVLLRDVRRVDAVRPPGRLPASQGVRSRADGRIQPVTSVLGPHGAP
jgi:asparagine synthase (glutamine-hydrolysing)